MKKIPILALLLVLCMQGNVNAFSVRIDDRIISEINNTEQEVYAKHKADTEYIEQLANTFSDRYVVRKNEECDISEINKFYENLSAPMTLKEIDASSHDMDLSVVMDGELLKKFSLFKMMGGMGGYTASFDKLVSFNIYRNISLVGGYTKYTKTYSKPDDAYWRYICELEDITREIVPYSTRIRLLNKMRELNEFTDNDNELNIFLLVDGKINSVWRKGTEYETSKE